MEFVAFLSENRENIESLYDNVFNKFKKEVESKADEIENLVDLDGTDFKSSTYRAKGKLKFVRYFERVVGLEGGECKIQIKLRLTPKEYRIEVWDRKSSDANVFHQFIEDRLGSNVANREGHKDNKTGSIIMDEFAYGEEADIVADGLNNLIEKLA